MKRKVLLCSIVAVLVAVAAHGTLAYFTAEDTAINVVTAGNIKIELREMAIPDGGGDPIPFENNQIGIMPGTEVSKIVTVKNTGEQPAYIRIKSDKSIILEEGNKSAVDLSLIECDFNTADWTQKDGWYYYNTPVEAGSETAPLFTTVSFSIDMSNLYKNSKAEIEVDAQATQVANNGTNVFDAAGWPKD